MSAWTEAEDAFLAMLCTFQSLPFGTRYSSVASSKRFNAVRIADAEALARTDWDKLVAEQAPHFAALNRPLTIQLPEPLVPRQANVSWVVVGNPYVHVRTPLRSFDAPPPTGATLRRCLTHADVELFVAISMTARVPPHLRDMAVRNTLAVLLEHRDGGQAVPYLFEMNGEPIGTVGCLPFSYGNSVFGLTVAERHRGQGHMKAIYSALAREIQGDIFGQIEEGLPTLAYRRQIAGTEVLARTFTYQRVDDPLRGVDPVAAEPNARSS
jgi:hypothetical protein